MNIEIDEKKILSGIFELDGKIHKNIKEEVERILKDEIVAEIKNTYFKNSWSGITDQIKNDVLEEIKGKAEEVIKQILKDFYDSYRYGKKDITILKKLKELVEEE